MNLVPLDFDEVKKVSLHTRYSKVKLEQAAKPFSGGGSFIEFIESLPSILAAREFRLVVKRIKTAYNNKKPIIWAMGAHVIKCGLGPIIIDLIDAGLVSALALNGAGIIHDVELALAGHTSEDVSPAIIKGEFGMAKETAEFINNAATYGASKGRGFGETLGMLLQDSEAPYKEQSVVFRAFNANVPVTVHIAIGGDIVHIHPSARGEAIGAVSFYDFRLFCRQISTLGDGGVILNIGSAVVLPVIIEKAIAVCRNLGYPVANFVGVNMDFIRHYRPALNPVQRAKELGGEGYILIGHHEIMFPLLAAAIKEEIGRGQGDKD